MVPEIFATTWIVPRVENGRARRLGVHTPFMRILGPFLAHKLKNSMLTRGFTTPDAPFRDPELPNVNITANQLGSPT